MSSRNKTPLYSLDRGVMTLHGRVVIGATGAVPAVGSSNNCRGFALTRTGVGAYTITMADKFKQAKGVRGTITPPCLFVGIELEDSTGGGGGAAGIVLIPCVKADAIDPSQTITFQMLKASDSTAAEIASGVVMKILLFMRDTVTPPVGV